MSSSVKSNHWDGQGTGSVLIPLILLLSILSGCADNTSDGSICPNERELLSAPDTGEVPSYKTFEGLKAFQDSLIDHWDSTECREWQTAEIEVKDAPLRVMVRKRCSTAFYFSMVSPIKPISIFANGVLLTNKGFHGAGSIDTLKNLISNKYPWKVEPREWDRKAFMLGAGKLPVFNLMIPSDVPEDTIYKALHTVREGYISKYERIAKEKYDTTLCTLTNEEIARIKKDHTTRFGITFIAQQARDVPTDPTVQKEPTDTTLPENTLTVMVDSNDRILIEGEKVEIDEVESRVLKFLKTTKGEKPINLKNQRGTSYHMYIQTQEEIKKGYKRRWDEMAKEEHGKTFDELDKKKKQKIQGKVPMMVSEKN